MNRETLIGVKNRTFGSVGYTIEGIGYNGGSIKRTLEPGEERKIPYGELEDLLHTPGGEEILRNYLALDSKEAVSQLFNEDPEPEYFYSEKDVKELLLTGDIDQLEDCLTYAPAGVIEMIKNQAVALKIPDMNKRKKIEEHTGFNVDNAIRNNELVETNETVEAPKAKRKSKKVFNESSEQPKYEIVED